MKRDLDPADWGPRNETSVPGNERRKKRSGPVLRRFGIVILLLATAAAAAFGALGAWTHRAENVLSRSAIVRGELTDIGPRFDGVLQEVLVRSGDRVQRGQVMARMADQHLIAQEAEAIAQIEGLERELIAERSSIGFDKSGRQVQLQENAAKVMAARAETSAATARLEEAQEYWRIRKDLAAQGMVSAEATREAEARSRVAAQMLQLARANESAAELSQRSAAVSLESIRAREERAAVLQAQLGAAKARLLRVRADIESSTIRAPADGAVVRVVTGAGGSVRTGMPILSFASGNDTWVEAWIDEDEIRRVRVGSRAAVTLPSVPGRELAGTVERIGVTTDIEQPANAAPEPRATRLRVAPIVGVVVRLESPPDTLLPGLSAVVTISTEPR